VNLWWLIAAVAVINIVIKGVGPAALTDRKFSPRVIAVIDGLAPALLAGLVVVDLLGQGWESADWTVLPGLAAAAVLWKFKVPDIVCVLIAVVVTAGLRHLLL